MAKSPAQRVKDSQEAAGALRLTLTLYGDDRDAWERLLGKFPDAHGAKMAAFREAVNAALGKKALSKAELMALIDRRLT